MKPEFEKASVTFLPESNCVIANFEADAQKNKETAANYNIGSYPTLKFFPKDNKEEPIAYEGARHEAAFVEYLNEKCGTHRAVGGGLNEEAGRHPEFDNLASKFFTATNDARSSIYQEAVTLAKTAGIKGQQYLKIMEKVVNGSEEYLLKESSRLKRILEKQALSSSKLDEIKVKANVLAAFAEQKAKEVKETVEEAASEATQKVKEEL